MAPESGMRVIANATQKPPKERNTVPGNVLPRIHCRKISSHAVRRVRFAYLANTTQKHANAAEADVEADTGSTITPSTQPSQEIT